MLKILSSEVSVDSDINHMPAVKIFTGLDFERYILALEQACHFGCASLERFTN